MRSPLLPRLSVLALAAALAGCASSRPDDGWRQSADRPAAPVAQADTSGPARVGLAATMDIPDNPYGDTAAVEVPAAADIASGAVPLGRPAEDGYADGGVDPNAITVGRYYYDDEGTTYYEDVADDLADDGQGYDDDVYYGGYYADYYRYGDPAYYPSVYTYYRPYSTYRPYVHYGWYPTWRHRRHWHRPYYAGYGYYDPYYAGYVDPYYGWGYYDPWSYGPGVHVSVGFGWGGYGYGSYGHGYRDGYYDGRYYSSAGYYGPGYYGRPRHRRYYDDYRDGRGDDDGRRSRIQGLPGSNTSPIAQSAPDPSRQPARRGLAPARLPRPSAEPGITRRIPRSTSPDREGRSVDQPVRTPRAVGVTTPPGRTGVATPTRATPTRPAPTRTSPTREVAPPRRVTREAPPRTGRPAPVREAEPIRQAEPIRRAEPVRRADPPRRAEPTPRSEPVRRAEPRRESRPAPAPRRESRPAPAPRRESRPAPAPRRESRPAPRPAPRSESRPAPRREARPSRSRGDSGGSSGRRSRRGDND